MKRPVFLLVTIAFNILCYSISAGKPQQDSDLSAKNGEDRNAFTYTSSNVMLRTRSIPTGSGYGAVPDAPGALTAVEYNNECYTCTDCPKIISNTTVRQCSPNSARCMVYSEKYNHLSNPVYIRGCVSDRGTCEEVKKSHEGHQNVVTLLSCEECFGDKCNTNGVPKSLPDITSALFFIVVCPVITKYTLS